MNGAEMKESVYISMLHLFAQALTSQKCFSSMGAGTDINLEKSDQIRNQGLNNSEHTNDFGQ